MKTLQLGVSDFALPSPRRGSIDAYSGYGGLPNVGQAIHLDVQLERIKQNPGYVPERWITHTFEFEGYKITVSGRMDGFLFGFPTRIEEIKSAYSPKDLLQRLHEQTDHPYRLQLRTYGYMQWLSSTTNVEPELNLLVVNARTRKLEELPVDLDREDYEAWLKRRLTELVQEQKKFEVLAQRRKKLAGGFVFPFAEPRPGQRELMQTVSENLNSEGRLLVQAPTGLGKTAGVLFPVLKESMGRGLKTIYLTAKNTQHEVAEDAVRRLQETGVKLRSVTIHAKTKMCMKEEPHCNPESCEFAKDYYSKVADLKLAEKLTKKKRLTRQTFRKMAEKFQVCPFELQMEALPQADVVVCDYNYVFSPRNSVGRLTHNGWTAVRQKPNLVIDEIHNLPSRATEYFSSTLSSDVLFELASQVPDEVRLPAFKLVDAFQELISELKPESAPVNKPFVVKLNSERFLAVASRGQELLSRYMESNLPLQKADPVVRLNQMVSAFSQSLELANEDFFLSLTPLPPFGGTLRLTCCDASTYMQESYQNFANMVGFSATLKPFEYYAQTLGLKNSKLKTAEFESPFPKEHRKLMVIPQISTKMRDRQMNYQKIKDTIERVVNLKPGNYFAFFPSFDFMNQVHRLIDLKDFRVLRQERDMRKDATLSLLESLKEDLPTLVFAVQGGVFAEGIDYPGRLLIGAFIVGPALPSFDFEREKLREYYEKKHGHGFDYAYTYPAMARVVQSAGRVIRSTKDRGLIILMDQRFTEQSYRKAMPKDWLDEGELVSTKILNDVREFWQANEP